MSVYIFPYSQQNEYILMNETVAVNFEVTVWSHRRLCASMMFLNVSEHKLVNAALHMV